MKKLFLLTGLLAAAALLSNAQTVPQKTQNKQNAVCGRGGAYKDKLYSLSDFVKKFDSAKDQAGRDNACKDAFKRLLSDADKFKTADKLYPVQLDEKKPVIYLTREPAEVLLQSSMRKFLSAHSKYGPKALDMVSKGVLPDNGKELAEYPFLSGDELAEYPAPFMCEYPVPVPVPGADKDSIKKIGNTGARINSSVFNVNALPGQKA